MKTKELFYSKGDAIYFRKPYTREKKHYVVTESFEGCPKDNSDKLVLMDKYTPSTKRIGVICSDTVMFDVFVNGINDANVYTPICSDMDVIGRGFDAITFISLPDGKDLEWMGTLILSRVERWD